VSLLVPPRRPSRELLDDPSLSAEEMAGSLADIATLDRRWGGSRILARWLLARAASDPSPRRARVLDIGAGSGEPTRRLRRALATGGLDADVFALDLQWRHLAAGAGTGDPPLPSIAGDAFHLPLADASVDWVVSLLFLHHFTREELAAIFEEIGRVSRRGFALLDLRRHVLPLAFVSVAGRFLFRTRTSRLDGAASIRQAYTPPELAAIAGRGGRAAEVRQVFPYRLLVTAERR